jgi:glycosyltransferase involved in cell wall biosynthesis
VFRIDGQIEDAAYADALAFEIARQSLGDKMTLGGPVAFEDRAACISAYDIFFFPSKSEGMPYVILEAMALGVAPLASHQSSCGFVRDYGGRVYRSIEAATAMLPTGSSGLADWRVDTEAFIKAYGIEKLKSFFRSLEP